MNRWWLSGLTIALLAACSYPGRAPIPSEPYVQRRSVHQGLGVSWATIGPVESNESGKLNAIRVDPKNASTLYVAGGNGNGYEVLTSAGIHKSTDGGRQWSPIDSGLTDYTVNDLWIDPNDDTVLTAATETGGIFRSTNGGLAWAQVSSALLAIAFAQNGGVLYAATAQGVLASSNGGASWSTAYATAQPVNAVFAAAGIMYAGCADGTIFKYSASGWTRAGRLPNPSGAGGIHSFAIDPLQPETAYASRNIAFNGYATQDLWVTHDGGASWSSVRLPAGTAVHTFRGTQVIAFSTITPHLLYAGGIRQYAFDGRRWTKEGYFGDERSIAVLPGSNRTERIYIGSDQGAYYSASIANVQPKSLTQGLSINVVRRAAVVGSRVVTTIQDFPPEVSQDSGAAWSALPYTEFYENGDAVLNPAKANDCAIEDPLGYDYSSDGCVSFTHVSQPSAPAFPGENLGLEIDRQKPSDVYAAGSGAVYRSTNYGATLSVTGWPVVNPAIVRIDPHDDKNVFVIGGKYGATLSVSHDGGGTWTQATGLPSYAYFQGVAVDPVDSKTVLLAGSTYYGVTVYRSTDGGNTFTQVSIPIGSNARLRSFARFRSLLESAIPRRFNSMKYVFPDANDLVFNPTPPAGATPALVLSSTLGIVLSSDLGSTWQSIAGDALTSSFESVEWVNGRLIVATDGEGAIVSSAPLQP